jgi:hypothetical protein
VISIKIERADSADAEPIAIEIVSRLDPPLHLDLTNEDPVAAARGRSVGDDPPARPVRGLTTGMTATQIGARLSDRVDHQPVR